MDTIGKINETLVSLFNVVLKLEEKAIKESSAHNLSITEVHTLVAIGGGKPKTMTQVAGALKVSVSTLTAAVNKLVSKGYVNRFRVPEDRRIVKIALTSDGAAAVQEHENFHKSMISEAITELTTEDAERFAKSIENINEFLLLRRAMPNRGEGPFSLEPMDMAGLKVPVPIFQGGMGIGVSMSRLAAAVSSCGGAGVISGVEPGFAEADFEANPLQANKRALKREIEAAIKLVENIENRGPIGVNILCASGNYEAYVKTAIEAGAEMIISGAGLPTSLPGLCKGSKVKLVPIVSSARAARIIIKNWAKKYNLAPNAIIFEGPMAGGHLGFKEEQIEAAREDFYKNIVQVKSELEGLPDCRLIVAGGIRTRSDCEKVLACGADGVQLGTRFVTTEECDACQEFKSAFLSGNYGDVTLISSPIGMPARVMNNSFVKKITGEAIPIGFCDNCLTTCKKEGARFCIKEAMLNAARGNIEQGLLFCGERIHATSQMEKVADIFREFTV